MFLVFVAFVIVCTLMFLCLNMPFPDLDVLHIELPMSSHSKNKTDNLIQFPNSPEFFCNRPSNNSEAVFLWPFLNTFEFLFWNYIMVCCIVQSDTLFSLCVFCGQEFACLSSVPIYPCSICLQKVTQFWADFNARLFQCSL